MFFFKLVFFWSRKKIGAQGLIYFGFSEIGIKWKKYPNLPKSPLLQFRIKQDKDLPWTWNCCVSVKWSFTAPWTERLPSKKEALQNKYLLLYYIPSIIFLQNKYLQVWGKLHLTTEKKNLCTKLYTNSMVVVALCLVAVLLPKRRRTTLEFFSTTLIKLAKRSKSGFFPTDQWPLTHIRLGYGTDKAGELYACNVSWMCGQVYVKKTQM